jgi:protein involved in polysaccharide export with SLBB domain
MGVLNWGDFPDIGVTIGGHLMLEHQVEIRINRIFLINVILCLLLLSGCNPRLSSPEELQQFNQANPLSSNLEFGYPSEEHGSPGPYRVVPGDVLEFQMPAVLRVISSDLPEWLKPTYGRTEAEPYLARINQNGTITLPIVGELHVAGNTLAEIETIVIDAYYPKYVVSPPMVVCEVSKYQRDSERVFAVVGLVNKSGVFPYPADVRYNLMEALAFAGGLDMVADPRYLKIYRQDTNGRILCATVKVESDAMTEAYGIPIQPGDLVYVDHTLSTRFNKFVSDVFHITVGADSRYTY